MPMASTVGSRSGSKGITTRTFRTLFGYGHPHQSAAVSLSMPASQGDHLPAAECPGDRLGRPELLLLETKWASVVSYGLTAQVLKDFLPWMRAQCDHHSEPCTRGGQRCEDELGEEQWAFCRGMPG